MEQGTDHNSITVKDEQLVAWPRVAAVAAMVSFSLPTFITGLEVYQGLSVHNAIYAILIASVILTIIGGIMGTIGTTSRLSSYLLVRIAFGDKGAGLVNLAFAISLLGWFGVNIDLFSAAVIQLSQASFDVTLPAWPLEILAGCLMLTTTVYGFKAINLLATLMVPVLALITGMLFFNAQSTMDINQFWAMEKAQTLVISDGVAAIVGAIIIGSIILPDITRFSRAKRGGAYTAIWAYLIIELIVLLVAALAAAAMGETQILNLLLALGIGLAAFVIVIAGSWILNSLNLYSTVLSIRATFPALPEKALTIVLGLLGIVAAFLNFLDIFTAFLVFLAALFVPVSGVIIIDFLLVSRERYQANTLDHNISLSLPALIAWSIGTGVNLLMDWGYLSSVSGITVIDAICLSGGLYWLLHKWLKPSQADQPNTHEENV